MKPWQILTLAGIGMTAVCLVCLASILFIGAILPTSATSPPTEVAIERQAPTIAFTLVPSPTFPLTPSPLPPTLAFTDTPIPSLTAIIEQQPASGGIPACIPRNPIEAATVVEVIDGDTIHVFLNGQVVSVRYIGIDTPEIKHPQKPVEPFGPEASAKNQELVGGKQVIMIRDVSEVDKYNRLLRYVLVGDVGGLFVNYELVRQGYAHANAYPPDIACSEYFLQAERDARQAAVGLWGAPIIPSLTPIALPTVSRGGGGVGGPCNCTGPDLDCSDFSTHKAAQACFDYCRSNGYGDVFRLDSDGDGLACESLP